MLRGWLREGGLDEKTVNGGASFESKVLISCYRKQEKRVGRTKKGRSRNKTTRLWCLDNTFVIDNRAATLFAVLLLLLLVGDFASRMIIYSMQPREALLAVGCWSSQKKRVLDFIERKARCYFFPTLFPNCFRVQIFSFNPFIIIISARFTGMIEWLLSLYARTFWFSHTDRVCVTPRRYVGRQTSHIKHETISLTSLFISKIILPTSYFYTLVD